MGTLRTVRKHISMTYTMFFLIVFLWFSHEKVVFVDLFGASNTNRLQAQKQKKHFWGAAALVNAGECSICAGHFGQIYMISK